MNNLNFIKKYSFLSFLIIAILFSNKSNSNSYNTAYAAIIGRKTGQGVDANWSAGELHFYTMPVGAYINNIPAMMINSAGNVGIGTTTPSTKLEVVGTITCTTLVETSSVASKTNVKKLNSQTAKIAKLSPVSFNYKNNNKRSLGLIAEEVAQVYPELVEYDNGQPLGVNYSKLTSVLISAVNELAAELAELKKQLNK